MLEQALRLFPVSLMREETRCLRHSPAGKQRLGGLESLLTGADMPRHNLWCSWLHKQEKLNMAKALRTSEVGISFRSS